MPQVEIKTERLLLRRWRRDDLDPYANICADPEVMRWIGNGTTRTRRESAEAIERFERTWEQLGFDLFRRRADHIGPVHRFRRFRCS